MKQRFFLLLIGLFITIFQAAPQKALVRDSIYIGTEKIKLERGKDYRIIKSLTDNKYAFQRLDIPNWNTLYLFSDEELVEPKISEIEVDCGDLYQVEEHKSAQTVGVYPQGKNFPLMLYAVGANELQSVGDGWNISHIFRMTNDEAGNKLGGTPLDYINTSKQKGMLTHTALPYYFPDNITTSNRKPVDSLSFAFFVQERHETNNVSWWDMPEEIRYWRADEYNMLVDYSKWTRKVDPAKRPNYLYIPGHYSKEAVENYVEYLDVLPASCYVEYAQQPRTYVRYQIEKISQAIEDRLYVEGKDYLNGEKTVIAIIELYKNNRDVPVTPEAVHHDFWSAIASGAKGIAVYSYHYKVYFPDAMEQLRKDASNLTGEEKLDQIILYGELDTNVSFNITQGDQYAPTVKDVVYPALNIRAFNARGEDGNCYKYIVAVNSSPEPITAEITNLASHNKVVKVLFEDRDVIHVVDRKFSDTFEGNGVHVYKVY